MQLRTAVWTGGTRDTNTAPDVRPLADANGFTSSTRSSLNRLARELG